MATLSEHTPSSESDSSAWLAELDELRLQALSFGLERERLQKEIEVQQAAVDAMSQQLAEAQNRLEQTELAYEETRALLQRNQERESRERERADQLREQVLLLHRMVLEGRMRQRNPFEKILLTSIDLVGAEKGVYLQTDGDGRILAQHQFEEAQPGSPLLQTVRQQVVEQQQVIALNYEDEINSIARDPLTRAIRNLAGYPIVIKEQLSGVVVVANKQGGPFTEEDTRLLLGVGSHAGVALENGQLRRDLEDAYAGTLALLCNAIEAKDAHTAGHCEEVAGFALAVARELGLNEDQQEVIFQSGLLHDVGKIGISDGILLKPGPLSPAEREVIETHCQIGADLLSNVRKLQEYVPVVLHHHERYDGKGYPERLGGEDIPLSARIITVADSYSTMLANRPYRAALDRDAARSELTRGAGGQFDPRVVQIFMQVLDAPDKLQQTWSEMYDRPNRFMSR